MTDLQNESRSFLIVGATGGVGRALTQRLSQAGARLVLGARNGDSLSELASEVGAEPVVGDVTSFDQARSMVEAAGPIDGVVNLAGSILLKPAHITSEADYSDTISQNLTSAFALVRAAVPSLRKRGGSIVLMSSAAASTGLANHEAIAAAKAGVEGLVRSAAATYAGSGVRVNCVAPGLVDTPLAEPITSNEVVRKASEAMHPLGRIGQPDEIACVIEWLLGPHATWVTGQSIGVDGGLAAVRGRNG